MNSILEKAMSEGLFVVTDATVMSEDDTGAQVTIGQRIIETFKDSSNWRLPTVA